MSKTSDLYSNIHCLYNINSLANLKSIMKYGLLSKNALNKLNIKNVDLSNPKVQSRRDNVKFSSKDSLHDYANLYFDARNPMLYTLIKNKDLNQLCILCISKDVLDLPDTIVSDRNAASSLASFDTPDHAYNHLNFNLIMAKYWNDDDPAIKHEKALVKCAEVLILNKMPSKYIQQIYVANSIAKMNVEKLDLNLPIFINPYLFFQ